MKTENDLIYGLTSEENKISFDLINQFVKILNDTPVNMSIIGNAFQCIMAVHLGESINTGQPAYGENKLATFSMDASMYGYAIKVETHISYKKIDEETNKDQE